MKKTVRSISKMKGGEKIAMITAYDAIFARLADEAGADMILVGDSLGNTFLGFDSTVPVSLEMMLHHTSAVARAKTDALVIADIPFGCAHFEFDRLLEDCRALCQKAGAEAVKIEGGAKMADKIGRLCDAGIAVMGHIGLQPQQVLKLGGYRKFGKTREEIDELVADAKALENAGVFSIVLEMCDEGTSYADQKQGFSQYRPHYDAVQYGLTGDRRRLYDRIDRRVDEMIARGLIEEVHRLVDKGLGDALTSRQAIGYKEIILYLDGTLSLEEATDLIKMRTRRYAKRQLSWFRRDPRVQWIDCDEMEAAEIVSLIREREGV